MSGHSASVHVLSGESGSGKTTLCVRTVSLLQRAGVQVAGIVSPARFEGGKKTGIFVQDVRTGSRRLLAEPGKGDGLGWSFDPEALRWGSDVLKTAAPCDVLVIDELGPLELKQGKGWTAAWDVLNAHPAVAALVVVRPSLVDSLKDRLRSRDARMISTTPSLPSDEELAKLILSDIAERE